MLQKQKDAIFSGLMRDVADLKKRLADALSRIETLEGRDVTPAKPEKPEKAKA